MSDYLDLDSLESISIVSLAQLRLARTSPVFAILGKAQSTHTRLRFFLEDSHALYPVFTDRSDSGGASKKPFDQPRRFNG